MTSTACGALQVVLLLVGILVGIAGTIPAVVQVPRPPMGGPGNGLGYPMKGHFRLESRDPRTVTGSYRRDGTAIGFSWTTICEQPRNLTQGHRATISGRMDRLFSSFLAFPTTDRT
jgi:hypothetical protein